MLYKYNEFYLWNKKSIHSIIKLIDLIENTKTLYKLKRAIYNYTDENGIYHNGEDKQFDIYNQITLKEFN